MLQKLKERFPGIRLVPARLDRLFEPEKLEHLQRDRIVTPIRRFLGQINATRLRQAALEVLEGKRQTFSSAEDREKALKDIQTRIEKAAGYSKLKPEDVEGIYLIPMRWAGDPETRETHRTLDSFFRRAGYVPGAPAINIKGWQLSPQYQTETSYRKKQFKPPAKGKDTGPEAVFIPAYYDPTEDSIGRRFVGGLRQSQIEYEGKWLALLRKEYAEALKEKDPVAIAAQQAGIWELPIPKHIATFEPLEQPVAALGSGLRLRTKGLIGIPSRLKKTWRVLIYETPHPNRIDELALTRPYPEDLNHVLKANGLEPIEKDADRATPTPDAQATVNQLTERHAKATALLIHLLHHRLKRTFGTDQGHVFMRHNTGPGAFFDFDSITGMTRERARRDIQRAETMIGDTHRTMSQRLGVISDADQRKQAFEMFHTLLQTGQDYIRRGRK